MEFKDCSLWHYLIYCEKLVIDAKEMEKDVEELESNAEEMESNLGGWVIDPEEVESGRENNCICRLCEKRVSGRPAYKCLECNFLIHASCSEEDMTRSHRSFQNRHHLIYVEEGENCKGQEFWEDDHHWKVQEAVCVGCKEAASGPTYKCSFRFCPFLIHKSCTHQSHVIDRHHAEQPDHISTLQLRGLSGSKRCDVCRQFIFLFLVYHCPICDFTIDMKCLSHLRINAEDDHQHALIPLSKRIPLTCQACGDIESKDWIHACSGCGVLIHHECGKFPHSIKVSFHNHSLTRTYFISEVKKQDPIFCNFCYKKVNIQCGAYYCRQCDYIVHMKCAWVARKKDESETINFDEYKVHMVYLVEGLNAREGKIVSPAKIKHFSHEEHELVLNEEEPEDEKRCEACMLLIIFAPFYSCQYCSFFLHHKCAKLPQTVTRGPYHPHPLTVVTTAPSIEVFRCRDCFHRRHGFAYACNKCPRYERNVRCVQCLFIPEKLNHESHTHPLFLAFYSGEGCNGCGRNSVRFRCTDCQFNLCWTCVILPLVTKHPCDLHLLKLTYGREDDLGVYYCFICEKRRDPNVWFYYCEECDFAAHIQCVIGENPHIKFGSILYKVNHQHPMKFVQTIKDLATCAFCDRKFYSGVALKCTQCNIQIHYDCNNIYEF